jgi:hypothetical protein
VRLSPSRLARSAVTFAAPGVVRALALTPPL